jgi:hypothetical protein
MLVGEAGQGPGRMRGEGKGGRVAGPPRDLQVWGW